MSVIPPVTEPPGPDEDDVVPPHVQDAPVEPDDAGDGVEPSDENEEPEKGAHESSREKDAPAERLVPKTDPVERTLFSINRKTGAVTERNYLQAPIQFFPKTELYGILGRAVKIVLEADTGVDVKTLMDMTNPRKVMDQLAARLPGAEDAPSVEPTVDQEMDAMKIMAAFAEVVSIAPGLLKEAYCVVLNVPTGHREWAIDHALNNMTDEEGFDILETFIDQSWEALEGFFTKWLPQAAQRTIQARERAREKRQSRGTR